MHKLSLGLIAFFLGSTFILLLPGPGGMPRLESSPARSTIRPPLAAVTAPVAPNWARKYGNFLEFDTSAYREDDYASFIQPGDDGGVVVVGAASLDSPDIPSSLFVIALDSGGLAKWSLVYGGDPAATSVNVAQGLIRTRDGGYVVIGHSAGRSSAQVLVLKVRENADSSPNGNDPYHHTSRLANLSWFMTLSQSDYDYAQGLCETADGGIVVIGQGESGSWAVKLDPLGEVVWREGLNFSPPLPGAVLATADGGFILAGYNEISKFDTDGRPLWHRAYIPDNGNSNAIYGLVPADDGGFFVIGYESYHTSGDGPGWLGRIDAAGNLIWQRGFADFFPTSGSPTRDGGVLLVDNTGQILGSGAIMKCDGSGRAEWVREPDGYDAEAVFEREDGGYVFASYAYATTGSRVAVLSLDQNGNISKGCPASRSFSIGSENPDIRVIEKPPVSVSASTVSAAAAKFPPYLRDVSAQNLCGSDSTDQGLGSRTQKNVHRKSPRTWR